MCSTLVYSDQANGFYHKSMLPGHALWPFVQLFGAGSPKTDFEKPLAHGGGNTRAQRTCICQQHQAAARRSVDAGRPSAAAAASNHTSTHLSSGPPHRAAPRSAPVHCLAVAPTDYVSFSLTQTVSLLDSAYHTVWRCGTLSHVVPPPHFDYYHLTVSLAHTGTSPDTVPLAPGSSPHMLSDTGTLRLTHRPTLSHRLTSS